jgi:hypothetical protein
MNKKRTQNYKHMSYEMSNQMIEDDDDDNDSLGSALSDYNGIFYGML